MAKDYHYCPKCGRKKLLKNYNYIHGYYYWECEAGAPIKESYRTRRAFRRREALGKPHPKEVPLCGCEIKVDGRDAEIADYGTVLDGMVRAMEPEIKTWLLENDTDVQRRGLEVLYEGESIDVVRMRDTHGVGVWAYFKEARKSGKHGELPEHAALTSRAARYIHFRFVPLSRIFQRGIRFRLWSRDLPVYSSHDHGIASGTVVFNGPLGKKKTKEIVEWAAALEATLPMLTESAKKEHARWEEERRELCQSVRHTVLSIEDYNGETKTSSVRIGGQLRLDQIAAIAEVLRKEEA